MRSFVTFFTLLVTSPCLWAQLPTIEFAGVTQPVVQKNTQVQLEVTGTFVDEPAELLFSDSALQAVAVPPSTAPFEEAKSSARFGLRVPTEVPSGLHQVRMRGRFGVSNPRPLLVVDKPVEIAQIPQSANAPLRTDCIYFGHFAPRDRVSFSVQLSPGEVFSCRAYTTQLDSQAIPAMALYDPSAGEICRARGIEDWPAEFSWTAQVAGSYTVVLHDFLYRGGNEFAFVLEGIVTSPESATQVSIDKWLRPSSRRKVTSCRELALNEDERATVSGSTAQAQNTSDTQTYQVPFAVAGNLQSGIPNQFDFEVKAGQQLRLDVCSQELGRLTDPRLYLFQHPATGETAGTMPLLSERDDEPGFGGPELLLPSKDPSLDWHAPQDGIYRVAVLDNESGQRPVDSTEFILRVSPPRPDFELFAYRPFPTNNPAGARPMGSNLLRGGTEVVRLLVNRKHGYAGPIDIEVLGLPDQITCSALSIPPDANSGVLILAAAEDAPAWCGSLSIVGKGATQSRLIERNAQPHAVSAKASAEMNRVHSRACDDLVILVNDNDVAPLSVRLGNSNELEIRQGASLKVPVNLTRRPGGIGACVARPLEFPSKLSMTEITIPADKSEGEIELKAASETPVGSYSIQLQAETKVKWRTNPQALTRAEGHLAKLEQMREQDSPEADRASLENAINNQKQAIERLKQETAEREFTVWIASPPTIVRVLAKAQD